MKNHTKSIVYIFTNGCSSELCKPLAFYEDYATRNGYKLFFVMTGYGSLGETLKQPFTNALFAIDNEYYNKKFSIAYLRYFENDLLKKQLNEKLEYAGNLYFFEGDKLVRILHELPKD